MAELYINRMSGEKVVRIEARNGVELLSRIELPLEDFAAALMGQGAVDCWFSRHRDAPGQPLPRSRDHR